MKFMLTQLCTCIYLLNKFGSSINNTHTKKTPKRCISFIYNHFRSLSTQPFNSLYLWYVGTQQGKSHY
jgi:hypothetical protein